MILLDPELEAEPAPMGGVASARAKSPNQAKELRMPSPRTLSRFLAEAQAQVRLRGQVSVLLTTDTAVRRLNRQFRGKNKATDVLSFPAGDGPGAEGVAGDLAISVPTAAKQSGQQGHALGVEIKVLILHGLLHLAGYDHEADEGQMARRERVLRARLGLPSGLIERAGEGFGSSTSTAKSGRKTGAAVKNGKPVGRAKGNSAQRKVKAASAGKTRRVRA